MYFEYNTPTDFVNKKAFLRTGRHLTIACHMKNFMKMCSDYKQPGYPVDKLILT